MISSCWRVLLYDRRTDICDCRVAFATENYSWLAVVLYKWFGSVCKNYLIQDCPTCICNNIHIVWCLLCCLQPLQWNENQHWVGYWQINKIYENKMEIDLLVCRYMGHLCGALAGLLVGLVLLENRKVKIPSHFLIFYLFSVKNATLLTNVLSSICLSICLSIIKITRTA